MSWSPDELLVAPAPWGTRQPISPTHVTRQRRPSAINDAPTSPSLRSNVPQHAATSASKSIIASEESQPNTMSYAATDFFGAPAVPVQPAQPFDDAEQEYADDYQDEEEYNFQSPQQPPAAL